MVSPRKWSQLALLAGVVALTGGVLVPAGAHASEATTVCADGCDFNSINAAISAAEAGATIAVGAGTYEETVTIDKSLTLVGPAAGISPNTGDPLVAADRGAEARIQPAVGDSGHAISVTGAASTVSLTGLTVDLQDGVPNQRFFTSGTATDRTVSISDTVFIGGTDSTNGSIVIDGALGNADLAFVGNRIENSGASNGLRVNNSSGTTNFVITDNVWLDNRGLAMNLSGAPKHGVISNNFIGNSTPGTAGVDNFGKRQGGMVLAGQFSGLEISGNLIENIEDAAFSLWSGITGILNITGNTINGYSNVTGYAAVYVRPSAGASVSDVSGVTFSHNAVLNPTEGSRAVQGQPDTGALDARLNWWGVSAPDFNSLVGGEVVVDPWYVDSAMSRTSAYPDIPTDTAGLEELVKERDLDIDAATRSFVPASGQDPANVDGSASFIGQLPWANSLDELVDVYAFSEMVSIGTFAIVDGVVQIDADLSALAPGTHRLLFVGQASGELQVMEITISEDSDEVIIAPVRPTRVDTGV